jgi:AcrR family transcriptional regulator
MLKSTAQKGSDMAKSGVGRRGATATGERTRERIVTAAIETLKTEGYAGASARAIARTGGFNQALVFYHFGSVNELLLAALDTTSAARMVRYREAVDRVQSLGDLFLVATAIYAEDLDSGHIKVLAELMAASTSFPELRSEIVARIEPWVQFTEDVVARRLVGSPFAELLAPRDIAYAIVALYLGMEMLGNLQDNRDRSDSLFETGQRIATLFESFTGAS